MKKSAGTAPLPHNLPIDGQSRWAQVQHFLPFCRETARKLEREGRFPRRIRISERCSVYPNRELHRWFADPAGYTAQHRFTAETETPGTGDKA
ncbi:AlpA family phage regulatory protein [Ralstonia syzygii]|uniref:AlpA family phage regulatory protein n=1 Tax=Ralstonia syzygii TaxID=28097 RepID=A0ABX7ZF36_9RALS|nr:AlpA family phage regulatory protein [Ralstonia syzygii]QUP53553.1 AlpA family phage regulatory protein [Ralstonia syzygii]